MKNPTLTPPFTQTARPTTFHYALLFEWDKEFMFFYGDEEYVETTYGRRLSILFYRLRA